MNDPMRNYRSLRHKIYTARHLFLKAPGLLQRLRLYLEFRRFARQWAQTEDFELKIRDVCAAPDNDRIPRVPQAGEIVDGRLIMHNGLRVIPDSYTGEGMTRLLQQNRGVHEPQEELAFMEILRRLKESDLPACTMVELGSYWAFYSLWFASEFPKAKCYCVEPESENLEFGKKNFGINERVGDFAQAFIGAQAQAGSPPTISVDSLVRDKGIEHVHILHADIQGHELEMLHGARESFARKMIDYVFVSSHHNFLHYRCMDTLTSAGFKILAAADLLETYSTDGVIVAGRHGLGGLESIPITPRRV